MGTRECRTLGQQLGLGNRARKNNYWWSKAVRASGEETESLGRIADISTVKRGTISRKWSKDVLTRVVDQDSLRSPAKFEPAQHTRRAMVAFTAEAVRILPLNSALRVIHTTCSAVEKNTIHQTMISREIQPISLKHTTPVASKSTHACMNTRPCDWTSFGQNAEWKHREGFAFSCGIRNPSSISQAVALSCSSLARARQALLVVE